MKQKLSAKMEGVIRKIKGVFPITVAEAVYTAPDTTLKEYLEVSDIGFANVRAFGAIGDGVADDRLAIQNALDSLANTGGTIYFPTGIYRIDNYLTYYSNQKIVFANGSTLLRGQPTQRALLVAFNEPDTTGHNGINHVEIIGGKFDMNATFDTEGGAILFAHGNQIKIRDCLFRNLASSWHYIECNSSKFVEIANCEFHADKTTSWGAEMIQIDGLYSLGVYPFPDHVGQVDGTTCGHIRIHDCDFIGNAFSPGIGNHTNMPHKYIYIYNNVFRGFKRNEDTGVNSRGAIDFNANKMQFIYVYDNHFHYSTKGAVFNGDLKYAFLTNNFFTDISYAIQAGFQMKDNIRDTNFIPNTKDITTLPEE